MHQEPREGLAALQPQHSTCFILCLTISHKKLKVHLSEQKRKENIVTMSAFLEKGLSPASRILCRAARAAAQKQIHRDLRVRSSPVRQSAPPPGASTIAPAKHPAFVEGESPQSGSQVPALLRPRQRAAHCLLKGRRPLEHPR